MSGTFRLSEWRGLISDVNAARQSGDNGCPTLPPVAQFDGSRPFSRAELNRIQLAVKQLCPNATFRDPAYSVWPATAGSKKSYVDEIRDQLQNNCECCDPLPCPFGDPFTEINLGWEPQGTIFGGANEYWFWPGEIDTMHVMTPGYRNAFGVVVVRNIETGGIITPLNSSGIFWQGAVVDDGIGTSFESGNSVGIECETGDINAAPLNRFIVLGVEAAGFFEVLLRLNCSTDFLPCCDDEGGGGGEE